ncbi:MAG: FHA domain-containing protein [Rhodoglobus sp.]
MNAGDESDFIVPPPGMVPERATEKPIQPEIENEGDVIELPPGLIDSGTYRMPQPPVSTRASTDDAPAFFPVSAQGIPAAPAVAPAQLTPPRHAPRSIDDPSANDQQATINDGIDEETSFAVAPHGALSWHLTLADGTQVALDRSTLIGRDPATNSQWPDAALLPVIDPSKSVSKTHAALQLTAAGDLFVHDLHSTNGVFVTHPESDDVVVEPGSAEAIRAGAQLRFGQFVMSVVRN